MSARYQAIRAAFEVLAASRIGHLVRNLSKARGVIFTLHRVLPDPPAAFAPNAILQVRPDFLEAVIVKVRELGLDIIGLDEAVARISAPKCMGKFAVFTFDDGYRDNREHALRILRRHNCPFTLYLPTALVDGAGEVWWQALEDIIASRDEIVAPGLGRRFATADLKGKLNAYDRLYAHMRRAPEPERVALIRGLADRYDYDLAAQCRRLIMDWEELAEFAAEPLCTIGAHTVHHYELAKLGRDEARDEMARSRDIIGERLGVVPSHISYPIGGRESAGPREYELAAALGFRTGVTTLAGGLYPGHRSRLTALPRISLNGLFQEPRYVEVFTTGAVFTALGRVAG